MNDLINIKRERFIITSYIDGELMIWCGLARNYYFKPINNIGASEIKTYRSEKQAHNVIEQYFPLFDKNDYEVRRITMTIAEETNG